MGLSVVAVEWVLERLSRLPPRRGAEWGSGGVFGLRFHRGVLYYAAAFEAEAHFIHRDREEVYDFGLVGDGPRSGGDTYNAVEAVDEYIYFGGWVNAPVTYHRGDDGTSKIRFYDKFSHVHRYDVDDRRVDLVWKEGVGREDEWAAEVSDIIYDPFNDRLLVCREDGHYNSGVYRLDPRARSLENVFQGKCLKGSLIRDMACFGVGENYVTGVRDMRFLDLVSSRLESFAVGGGSVDEHRFFKPVLGEVDSAYNRVFAFVRGGVIVGNPYLEEPFTFVRLFDFSTFYAPFRTNSVVAGGGILIPYNAHHDSVYQPVSDEARFYSLYTNTITGPSVLVYITPPTVKIVGAFGARITSLEKAMGKLILAANNTPNAGGPRVTPFDCGEKDFIVLDEGILQGSPPPVCFTVPLSIFSRMADAFGADAFGGIPLTGYRRPRLTIRSSRQNTLTIHEYDLSLPPLPASEERYLLKEGRNVIDLNAFSGIVSFSVTQQDPRALMRIDLA